MTKALDGQLANTGRSQKGLTEAESPLGCKYPHVTYCDSIAAAVRYVRARGKAVVVVSQPILHGDRSFERHTSQHEMLGGLMSRAFGGDTRVRWADLSTVLDLRDPKLTFDGMHLNPEANATVANALVDPVVSVAKALGEQQ